MSYYPSDDDSGYEKLRDELEDQRLHAAFLDELHDHTVELVGADDFAAYPVSEAYARAALKAAGVEPTPEYIADLASVAESYEGGCPAYHVVTALMEMVWPGPRNSPKAPGTCRPSP